MTSPTGIASPVDTAALQDALTSHAQALGIFDSVNGHEPRRAPGNGLAYATWFQRVRPFAPQSGLAVTSAAMIWNGRLYRPVPGDASMLNMMDPYLADAACALIASYSADFTLDGLVSSVDLLGRTGVEFGLGAEMGYLEQDGTLFRVATMTLPLIINDVFEQVA